MKKFLFPVTLALLLAAGCSKQVSPEERDIPISLDVRLEGSTKATHEDAGTIKDLDFIVRDNTDAKYSFSTLTAADGCLMKKGFGRATRSR